jgi:glyoxylase-like metal-dependent hydrolase (beta-lactamase superfamily II)
MRLALILAGMLAAAPGAAYPPAWTRPVAPFHVVGPVWYVGTAGLGAYLIRTRAGAMLIDATIAENAPTVLRNIAAIGVRPRDVELLLVSHAHYDHVGGDAAVVRATGAAVAAGVGDVPALESGMPPGEPIDDHPTRFAPVRVSRALHDRDTITLGGVTLTALITPGHTPGCTTYTMRVPGPGRPLDVVFPCSIRVGGNRLVGNRRYPGIVADFRRSFARIGALHADVVLPAHPEIADVMAHRQDGRWVQPGLLQAVVARSVVEFDTELKRQAVPRATR